MARVSDYFALGRAQPELDFVDVDVVGDLRVFLDPRALRLLPTDWGHHCVYLIQSYFQAVLDALHASRTSEGLRLLGRLREPNETHLGLSADEARGRALGPLSAQNLWDALASSEAAKTGLLEDLEDTILMVEGISSDIVSDITTNVIREPLILYTQMACDTYGIPLVDDVDSGPLWNPDALDWENRHERLPMANGRKLLLVPKAIVRQSMEYDVDEYYRDFILEDLRLGEISANTELVHVVKRTGLPRVTNKDLMEKYGRGKHVVTELTRRKPELLDRYRGYKRQAPAPPMGHTDFSVATGAPVPDWDDLLKSVLEVQPGRTGADAYHRAVEKLLTALLYPALTMPTRELPIHDGRKRIDISFVNTATDGFFAWVAAHYPAAYVFVECKNYSADPQNPELDQLAGRFSPQRGQFGMLICRRLGDRALFADRCRDTARDHRGYVVALDDDDLRQLVDAAKEGRTAEQFDLIRQRFDHLVL